MRESSRLRCHTTYHTTLHTFLHSIILSYFLNLRSSTHVVNDRILHYRQGFGGRRDSTSVLYPFDSAFQLQRVHARDYYASSVMGPWDLWLGVQMKLGQWAESVSVRGCVREEKTERKESKRTAAGVDRGLFEAFGDGVLHISHTPS